MVATKRIKRALVSVFHKDGLDEILKKLHNEGVSFVSTGGTQSFIESLGLPCDAVEDLTTYPFAKEFPVDMCIYLGGGDFLMPQHFLDSA